ncbi:glycosyltransferase family protein [Lysinibacillus sp. FSL K6-0057]|uniref:glycosyltransferase family protein n=1 Tax=Lysinibacillus sp. FSL K6-0057 TaxID=2921411 RepID=UPI00315AEF9D
MNIIAITQARMGSTRLPGKVLKKVARKTLLEYQLECLKKSEYIKGIVVATTREIRDKAIVQLCEQINQPYFRGSEKNVLERYYLAAKQFKADIVVRITSDCPVIDIEVVDNIIKKFMENKVDYASNTIERTYPRGMDTEVFTMNALETAYRNATEQRDIEHVTPYMYFNPKIFRLLNIKNDEDYSKYRWTVDTEEDFELIEKLILELHMRDQEINLKNLLQVMHENKDWYSINAHIEQKKV